MLLDRQCKRSIMDTEAVQQAAAGSNLQPSSLASGVSVFSGVHGTARAWSGE
ncbi:hypothetical protein PPTG_24793, partial [Phytophthora nicotianae INRA-310]